MRTPGSADADGIGCYGLRLDGIPSARPYLGIAEPGAPRVTVIRREFHTWRGPFDLTERSANVPLSDRGSWARLDRTAGTAELMLRKPYSDEELLHPLLSGTCALFNWWHGRDAFHAGAFVLAGRAWIVVGDKGFGKSTLLSQLAGQGIRVLSDDLVVERGGDVLPGPAFVDLRPDAAVEVGVGRDMGMLGARPRYRVDIAAAQPTPLAGWINLAWGPKTRLRLVPLAERLPRLFASRAVLLRPAAPEAFIRYAALPFFELERPKQWSSMIEVTDMLTSTLAG